MDRELTESTDAAAYAALERENARLASALAALQAQGAELPASTAKSGNEFAALRQEVEEKTALLEMALAHDAAMTEALAATHASFSWRVTAPLRAVKAIFKRSP